MNYCKWHTQIIVNTTENRFMDRAAPDDIVKRSYLIADELLKQENNG